MIHNSHIQSSRDGHSERLHCTDDPFTNFCAASTTPMAAADMGDPHFGSVIQITSGLAAEMGQLRLQAAASLFDLWLEDCAPRGVTAASLRLLQLQSRIEPSYFLWPAIESGSITPEQARECFYEAILSYPTDPPFITQLLEHHLFRYDLIEFAIGKEFCGDPVCHKGLLRWDNVLQHLQQMFDLTLEQCVEALRIAYNIYTAERSEGEEGRRHRLTNVTISRIKEELHIHKRDRRVDVADLEYLLGYIKAGGSCMAPV